jgi:hypothetical protein
MTKYFISEYIGYSKLLFLDSDDKYTIINEELGKWTDGNWYSNDSYKQYNDFKYYGNEKVYNTSINGLFDDLTTTNNTSVDYLDEWNMYEYICDVYGLDPEDESTWDDIDYYMELNNVDELKDLFEKLTQKEIN